MKSILLTIPALLVGNILSANEIITPVNKTNDGFWNSPLILGALFAMMVIILLVMVRAAIDVIGLYRAIKKTSRKGGCTNQIPLTIKPYPML